MEKQNCGGVCKGPLRQCSTLEFLHIRIHTFTDVREFLPKIMIPHSTCKHTAVCLCMCSGGLDLKGISLGKSHHKKEHQCQ